MNENITFEQALENIQNYAINIAPSIARFREDPAVIAQLSDFHPLLSSVFNKVPVELLEVYGEKRGKLEWQKLAKLYFQLVVLKETRAEVVRLMRALLTFRDEERKLMYKGKDGEDYISFEQVRSANEFYAQQENSKIEKGRSR